MEEWDEAKSDWAECILCSLVAISPLPAVAQFKGFATALPWCVQLGLTLSSG